MGLRGRLAAYDVLALTAGVWFLAKFLRYLFPPLFSTFQGTYGVSNAAVGVAFSGLMVVYAATQFPSGALADRAGAVAVIVAGALVAASGAFVLAVPVPFAVLVAAMGLVGLGTGAHKTVAVRLLARVYPARTGRALGAFDTVGAFGGVAAPAVVVVALAGPGWHAAFLAAALAGVILAALTASRVPGRVPDDGDDAPDGLPNAGEYVALFRRPRFAAFVTATVLFAFAYNGTVAFLPLYLSEAARLPTATANALYSGLFLASLVQLGTGEAGDRVGPLPVLAATALAAALGLGGLLAFAGRGPLALGAAVAALGLGSHGFRPVRGTHLMAVIPDDVAGGGLGVVRTLLMGAGAVAPAVAGVLADVADYRTAFLLLGSAMAGAAVLVLALLLTADR